MAKTKKEYERTKDRILNSKLSEIEKAERLTNNWFNYIFHSGEKAKSNSLKYQSEQVRVRV